jgi:hypothetical protein
MSIEAVKRVQKAIAVAKAVSPRVTLRTLVKLDFVSIDDLAKYLTMYEARIVTIEEVAARLNEVGNDNSHDQA